MRLRPIAIALLLVTLSPASHAAITAGRELPLSSASVAGTYGDPHAVATDGTDFLTLWADQMEGRQGVYATVVTETGATRPLAPRPLENGPSYAQAVWTGDAYLVLLSRYDSIAAVRLNRDAEVISDRTQLVSGPTQLSDLAWNGRRALALVTTPEGVRTAMLLDASGRITRSGIPIPSTIRAATLVAAAAGDAFIVVWTEEVEAHQPGIPPLTLARAVRISDEGVVGQPIELMPATRGHAMLDAASGQTEAGVAIEMMDYVPRRQLWRFTINGTTLAVNADPVVAIEDFGTGVQVVSTPSGFVAAYTLLRVNVAAGLIGSIPFHSSTTRAVALEAGGFNQLRLASNGRTVMAVVSSATLRAVALDTSLTQRTSALESVATSVVRQSSPTIAAAGNTSLYAWVESSSAGPGLVKVRRFDSAGNPLDAQPLTVGVTSAGFQPAVTFTGKVWLVAWQPESKIGARIVLQRVSPQGALLDTTPVDLGPGNQPVIASNGTTAVVASTEDRRRGIFMVRLSADGERLDTETVVVTDVRADRPSIGTNGREYLLTWSENYRDVVGVRLAADGSRLDVAPIAIARTERMDSDSYVASDGTDFLVAFVSYIPTPQVDPPLENPPPPVNDVFVKRVLRTGALADTTAEQYGSYLGAGVDPALTFTNGHFIATFINHETRDPLRATPDWLSIYATTTNARGEATAPARRVLSVVSYSSDYGLATVGESVWITHGKLAADLGNVQRVYTRALEEDEAPFRRRATRR
jgi:hypothetical protein